MKKLLTSFLALVAVCLAALPGNSQTITIEGGGDTTCGSLEEAMAAAEDGGVILLSGEYELPKRLTATKNITIKGDGSAVIKRKDKNNLMFLDAENCAFTLSNLTIDGANLESGKALMEFSNNDKNKIENVKIINAINTANSGLIQVKSSNKKPGGAHINGMTVENCSILEGYGDVFVGRNALYISGDNNFSIFCEKTYRVNVEGELTNKVPLVINIDGSREDAKAIVIGSKDPSKFYAPAGEFVPKSNYGRKNETCNVE